MAIFPAICAVHMFPAIFRLFSGYFPGYFMAIFWLFRPANFWLIFERRLFCPAILPGYFMAIFPAIFAVHSFPAIFWLFYGYFVRLIFG